MSAMATSPLRTAFDSPEAKRRHVRRLFATIADRYDLITRLLSWGRDRRWKIRLIDAIAPARGARLLDLACGTGDLAVEAAARGASVTGLDITPRMVELASAKPASRAARAAWLVGDMTALPLADASYDAVTTGYGLRNVPDLTGALVEIRRVLRPGGTIGSLDFNRPDAAWLRAIYLTHLTIVGSTLGWILHRDADTYRYIPESIRRYPGAERVAGLMRDLGFVDVRVVRVLGGLMAIHLARKPGDAQPAQGAVRT